MTPIERHPIEVESYRIMRERVDFSMWPPGQRDVVARMVHATADESFAASARIGADALLPRWTRCGAAHRSSSTRRWWPRARVHLATMCLLDEVPTAPDGSTRSAAAMVLAAKRHPDGAIWVVGNAPTALAEVLALHERGDIAPAAVVGLPVGYVGAADAKAALWDGPLGSISITNAGERGGSPVAVAVLNALRHLCEGDSC